MFISRLNISFQNEDQSKLAMAAVAPSSIQSDCAPKCRRRSSRPKIITQPRKRASVQPRRRLLRGEQAAVSKRPQCARTGRVVPFWTIKIDHLVNHRLIVRQYRFGFAENVRMGYKNGAPSALSGCHDLGPMLIHGRFTNPLRMAYTTSSAVLCRPSAFMMLARCTATVLTLRSRSPAISLFDLPMAMS